MKFLNGMFRDRRTSLPATETASLPPEPVSWEATVRLEREREMAKQELARRQASRDEITHACAAVGFWWPGDAYPAPQRRRSLRARVGGFLDELMGGR